MNDLDLTGKDISTTYPRLVQFDKDTENFYDGLGATISISSQGSDLQVTLKMISYRI